MAVTNFVPDLWTARLLVSLRKNAVAAALVNRDYEGEIRRQGDTVKITSVNDVTIGTYTAHSDITVEDIDDATRSLLIDQAKYFAFELDDIERAQAVNGGAVLAQATDNASYQLKDTADSFLLSTIHAGAAAGNDLGLVDATASNAAYDLLVDLAVKLDENNVPDMGRFVVVSPAFHGLLLKDDRFISAGDAAGAAARANGRIGEAAGLQVHKSNNLPNPSDSSSTVSDESVVIASYSGATTFAEQIVSVEAARMEKRFADMVKGLHVYGAKVVRDTGIAVASVSTAS